MDPSTVQDPDEPTAVDVVADLIRAEQQEAERDAQHTRARYAAARAQARALAHKPARIRSPRVPRHAATRALDRETLARLQADHRRRQRLAPPIAVATRAARRTPAPPAPPARGDKPRPQSSPRRSSSRSGPPTDAEPPPARRELIRRRAARIEFRRVVDRVALTTRQFHEQTEDLAAHERRHLFETWLPQHLRDEFLADVQTQANLEPGREGWQA